MPFSRNGIMMRCDFGWVCHVSEIVLCLVSTLLRYYGVLKEEMFFFIFPLWVMCCIINPYEN